MAQQDSSSAFRIRLDEVNERVLLNHFKAQSHQFKGTDEIKGLQGFTSLSSLFQGDALAKLVNGLFDLVGSSRVEIRKAKNEPPSCFDIAHHRESTNLVLHAFPKRAKIAFNYAQLVEDTNLDRRRQSQLAYFHQINNAVALEALSGSRRSTRNPLTPFLKKHGASDPMRSTIGLKDTVKVLSSALGATDSDSPMVDQFCNLAASAYEQYGVAQIISADDAAVLEDFSTYLLAFMVALFENPSSNLSLSQLHDHLSIVRKEDDTLLELEVSVSSLPDMDDNSQSDPVVVIQTMDGEALCCTEYKLNDNNPTFNTLLAVPTSVTAFKAVIIDMDTKVDKKSKERVLHHEVIGSVDVDVASFFDVKSSSLTQAKGQFSIGLSQVASTRLIAKQPAPTLNIKVVSVNVDPSFVAAGSSTALCALCGGARLSLEVEHTDDSFTVVPPSAEDVMAYMELAVIARLNKNI